MPGITNSPDALNNYDIAGIDFYTASGAITGKKGTAVLSPVASPPGALNMTLAAPISGTDDGKSLRIWSLGAYAHTVTCPAGGVNGTQHLLTFTAAANNFVTLLAISGSWYVTGQTNVTAS
jgi:hypothetical protein